MEWGNSYMGLVRGCIREGRERKTGSGDPHPERRGVTKRFFKGALILIYFLMADSDVPAFPAST